MAAERTEAPTPRRRQEARELGQVPRSAEITAVAAVFAGLLALRLYGPQLYAALTQAMRESFVMIGSIGPGRESLSLPQAFRPGASWGWSRRWCWPCPWWESLAACSRLVSSSPPSP